MTLTQPVRLPTSAPQARRDGRLDAVVLGVLAAVVGFSFSWVPSLWYDEAATVVSATRPLTSFWQLVQSVDAVHAAYYLVMHVWFDLVGYSPLSLRLPSAVAGGAAVAATVVLMRMLASRRLAIITGIVLMALPRFSWAVMEGRSYATTVLLAAVATILLVLASEADVGERAGPGGSVGTSPARSRRLTVILWAVYAAVVALGTVVFVYSALLVVAHLLTVVLLRSRGRVPRGAVTHLIVSATAIAALTSPLVWAIVAQAGQVSWIDSPSVDTIFSVLVVQYSPFNVGFAILAWAAVTVACVHPLMRRFRPATSTAAGTATPAGGVSSSSAVVVLLPVVVVPTALIIAASVVSPLYSPRYLTFTTFAFAALIDFGVDRALSVARRGAAQRLGRRMRVLPLTVAAVVVVVGVSAPSYVAQRTVEAKQQSSWSTVAALVESYSPVARAETAVVYGRVAGHPTATARIIENSYPAAFRDLRDVTLSVPYTEADTLWGAQEPLAPSMLQDVRATWLIASDRSDATPTITTIGEAGLVLERRWHFSDVDVLYFTR